MAWICTPSADTPWPSSPAAASCICNAITYNPATQVMHGNWKFETLDEDGSVIAPCIRPLAMRQAYSQELRYLLEPCSFEVLARYGDCYRSEADTGRCVWVLQKK